MTEGVLARACERSAAEGKRLSLPVRDNAGWHVSKRMRPRIKAHTLRVEREGGVRTVACCGLPIEAPWLDRIEPCWAHGKRAILDPDRKRRRPR